MNSNSMQIDEARKRMNPIPAPTFWVGSWQKHLALLKSIKNKTLKEIALSPGGRPIHLLSYGEKELKHQNANFNSACGANSPESFCDRSTRLKPVIFIVGPVHGHEVEGLTGIHNLLHLIENKVDLRGKANPELTELLELCRIVIIPCSNPDGLYRFEPDSLVGANFRDLRFWGQGTHAGGEFWGHPNCKRLHPMTGPDVEFTGCYFNDAGINPMHDDFFEPKSTEVPAILKVAKEEAPDVAVSMHSYGLPPGILQTAFVPIEVQEGLVRWSQKFESLLKQKGYKNFPTPDASADTIKKLTKSFNLTSALYHISGAMPATYESPHGLSDEYQIDHNGILETQLLFFQCTLEVALEIKKNEME